MEILKVKLKVTGHGRENGRGYMTVNYKDEEYRVQKFTMQENLNYDEQTRSFVVQKLANGSYKIVQDLEEVVPEFYEVGKTYPFEIFSLCKKFHYIVDCNGLRFKLTEFGSAKLKVKQKIEAEITSIENGYNLFARLVEKEETPKEERKYLTFEELKKLVGISDSEFKILENNVYTNPLFKEARELYEDHDNHWVLKALQCFDEDMYNLAGSNEYLETIRRIAMFLIERSHIIRDLFDEERYSWMQKLSSIVEHAEDYQKAYKLHEEGEDVKYIEEQFTCLRESENLYQPTRKFRIILSLFSSSDDLVASMMDKFFDIILKGQVNHWKSEPFRSAFVEMLEIFIAKYKNLPDKVGIDKLIKALAIQLYLSEDQDEETFNRRINSSMFYRFLASTRKQDAETMLSKAFECLFSPFEKKSLEYEWEDIANVGILHAIVSVQVKPKELKGVLQAYRGNKSELLVEDNNIEIQPINADLETRKSIEQNKQMSWNNLKVYLNDKPGIKLKGSKSIAAYKECWDAIENELDRAHNSSRLRYTYNLSKGDDTWVKVVRANEDGSAFYCSICDGDIEGGGWLNLSSIAKYLKPSKDLIEHFKDSNGNDLILPVHISGDDNAPENYSFTMIPRLEEICFDRIKTGDKLDCMIVTETSDLYIGFATNGASVRIVKEDGFEVGKGQTVKAVVSYYDHIGSQFECHFEKVIQDSKPMDVAMVNAFWEMLNFVSWPPGDMEEEEDYYEQESIIVEDMPKETAYEILSIIDRIAVLMPTRHETYNYLAVASIISKMLGDYERVEYYRKRKSILQLFEDYEKQGSVNSDLLEKINTQADSDLVANDYTINEHVTMFKVLDAVNDHSKLEMLYEIRNSTTSETIRKACSAAMSLILISEFNLPEVNKQTFDALNDAVGLKIKRIDKHYFGQENKLLEFKSSMVYPAGYRMQPHPRIQEIEIMKVICCFLNGDDTATLYLGVNDYGYAVGVHQDMDYMGTRTLEVYSKDLMNKVYTNFGIIGANCCHTKWEKVDGYDVLQVRVDPCEDMVTYKDKYYIRNDSEKRVIADKELGKAIKHHQEAYTKWKAKEEARAAEEMAVQENSTENTTTAVISKESSQLSTYEIATSAWRKNVTNNWEEDYGIDVSGFVHFLPKSEFKVTSDSIYEDVHLSLAVKEEEKDGYLVVVYESAKVLLVKMSEILERDMNKSYKRCKDKVRFVCPLKPEDGLVTVWKGSRGEKQMRIDDIPALIDGHHEAGMVSNGQFLNEYLTENLLWVEVVDSETMSKLHRFRNQGNGLGQKLSKKGKDMDILKNTLRLNPTLFD